MTFAERLKELRKRKGLTQTQLADALGVHLQTVSKWERGVTEPDISLIGETAAALGATVEELAGAPSRMRPSRALSRRSGWAGA